jgi:hypothetical protein
LVFCAFFAETSSSASASAHSAWMWIFAGQMMMKIDWRKDYLMNDLWA